MIEVLRNKNLTTRFQILVEIANSGPNIQQRDIANELDITPQAVSDYVAQLIKDKMLTSEGRSSYRVTNEGVNWIIKALRELNSYNTFIQRAVTNISICTALAESDLKKNQKVGLKMKEGLLFASPNVDGKATGITISEAGSGEDVGITDIKGIVPLELGRVTIVRVPGIQSGGSRKVNIDILRENLEQNSFVTSLGLEALATLRKAGVEFHQYGAAAAAIEATKSGLNALVVCVENETSDLITKLEKEGISYELIDAEISSQ
jgi:putative transcriptional regulator